MYVSFKNKVIATKKVKSYVLWSFREPGAKRKIRTAIALLLPTTSKQALFPRKMLACCSTTRFPYNSLRSG